MLTPVDKIKEKIDITELVGSYLKLQKAGVNYKALCPFHTERTPSFYVTPSRQIWHCFGCNAGGDIFRFVMNIEGVEFPEALRILAEKAGIQLERQDPKLRSERIRMLDLLEMAAVYYEKNLLTRKDIGAYLKERGMTGETAKSFRIGYAVNSWDAVLSYLQGAGFKRDEIERAGLSIKSEKDAGYYDRFRARIMFPIFDGMGRIVGFSGRIFSAEGELASGGEKIDIAKYINTPQTILYDKSRVLYGFERAKTEIRKNNSAVILEGQMDLIMSHQAGAINAVAVSGTALTAHHLLNLKRLCDTLVMSFDTDEAGYNATKKNIDLAVSAGFDVKVASMEEAKDPADLIKENPQNWLNVLKNAKPVVSFFLETLKQKYPDSLSFKKEVGRVIFPHIALMQNEIVKAHWIGEVAQVLKMREESIYQEIARLKNPKKEFLNDAVNPRVRARKGLLEERIIGISALNKKDLSEAFKECNLEWFSPERRHIFESIFSGAEPSDHYVKKLALEAEVVYPTQEDLSMHFSALVKELKKEYFKEKLVNLGNSIRELEGSGNKEELEKTFSDFRSISAELNSL